MCVAFQLRAAGGWTDELYAGQYCALSERAISLEILRQAQEASHDGRSCSDRLHETRNELNQGERPSEEEHR